jgi:hypothetical protein
MNTETRPTAAPLQPSPELVNALLKWPEQLRLSLGKLLLDSVKEGFTSLEEAEQRDRELIRTRVEQVVRGEVQLLDWRESLDRIERQFREKFPK